jgi:phosphatidylserine synthase
MNPRWLLVSLAAIPILILQAWDSDVFTSPLPITVAVLVALLLPLLTALWTTKAEVLLAVGIASLSTLMLIQVAFSTVQGDLIAVAPLLALLLWMRWHKQPQLAQHP